MIKLNMLKILDLNLVYFYLSINYLPQAEHI